VLDRRLLLATPNGELAVAVGAVGAELVCQIAWGLMSAVVFFCGDR